MSPWQVIVPVWGDRYRDVFAGAALPSLRAAIEQLPFPADLVLYTDRPAELTALAQGLSVITRPVPGPDNSFYSMSAAHRDAMDKVKWGTRLALLTADMVISSNTLKSCEAQFAQKRMVVACAGMRVNDTELPGPAQFSSGRALLAWGWEHRHRMTRESTWPEGTSYDVWRMYFEKGDQVACRLCLPHPIALVRDSRDIRFYPTIDVNVVSNYRADEVYLVTDPDEVAAIELSPPDKEFMIAEPMKVRYERQGPSLPPFGQLGNPRHRAYFDHRIIIKGNGTDCGDGPMTSRLVHGL